MSLKKSSPTASRNWASLLETVLVDGQVGRPKGEEWRSVKEFADEQGLSAGRAHAVLSKLHGSGALERVRAKVGVNWLFFFRPHETPASKPKCTPTRQSLPPLRATKRPHAR